MLNAASAIGPREIQIGLPSADVNVLENGLPVTYATNPHSVNTIWRGDASLSHQGLLKIAETAITTGNIGYAVNSFTQKGQKGFNGTLNYKSNHFGLQEFSLNMNGDLGSDWYYSFNMYQDFDPGTFKIKSTPYQDRTQIYKALLTKKYNGNRGEFTACIDMPTAIAIIAQIQPCMIRVFLQMAVLPCAFGMPTSATATSTISTRMHLSITREAKTSWLSTLPTIGTSPSS